MLGALRRKGFILMEDLPQVWVTIHPVCEFGGGFSRSGAAPLTLHPVPLWKKPSPGLSSSRIKKTVNPGTGPMLPKLFMTFARLGLRFRRRSSEIWPGFTCLFYPRFSKALRKLFPKGHRVERQRHSPAPGKSAPEFAIQTRRYPNLRKNLL